MKVFSCACAFPPPALTSVLTVKEEVMTPSPANSSLHKCSLSMFPPSLLPSFLSLADPNCREKKKRLLERRRRRRRRRREEGKSMGNCFGSSSPTPADTSPSSPGIRLLNQSAWIPSSSIITQVAKSLDFYRVSGDVLVFPVIEVGSFIDFSLLKLEKSYQNPLFIFYFFAPWSSLFGFSLFRALHKLHEVWSFMGI